MKRKISPASLIPPLTKADRFPLVFRVSIVSSTIWNRLQCGGTVNNTAFYLESGIVSSLKSTRRWQHWPAVHALIQDHRRVLFQKNRGSDDLTGWPWSGSRPTKQFPSVFYCLNVLDSSLSLDNQPLPPQPQLSSPVLSSRVEIVWFDASVGQRLCRRQICVFFFLISKHKFLPRACCPYLIHMNKAKLVSAVSLFIH